MSNQYALSNQKNGFYVDVQEKSGTPTVGTLLDAFPGNPNPKPNQLWTFEPGPFVTQLNGLPAVKQTGIGERYYLIKSALNGLVMEVQANTKLLCLAEPGQTNNLNQLWSIFPYTSTTEVEIDESPPSPLNYVFIMNGAANDGDQSRPYVIDIQEKNGTPGPGTLLDAFPMKSSGVGNQLWFIEGQPTSTGRQIIDFPTSALFSTAPSGSSMFSVDFLGTGFTPGAGVSVEYIWDDTEGNQAIGSVSGPTEDPTILTADFAGNLFVVCQVWTVVNTGGLSLTLTDGIGGSVTLETTLAANGTFYNTTQS